MSYLREQMELQYREYIKYKDADLNKNVFEFAKKYSSDGCKDNLFKIYSDKDILLFPNEKALVAIVEYDPKIVILPNHIFYGTALKMEVEINNSIMEIYIHNTSTNTYNQMPDYFLLENLYKDVFDYMGARQDPVYFQKKSELIAIGIKAPYDFDLEKFCCSIFQNRILITNPVETLQLFEDYKEWILNAKNSRETLDYVEKANIKQFIKTPKLKY